MINWFEGGRRIRTLCMALVAIGGSAFLFFAGSTTVFLFSSLPDEPWHFLPNDCDYPNHAEYLGDSEATKLAGRKVTLCFVAQNGKIPYASAVKPDWARAPIVESETSRRAQLADGTILEFPGNTSDAVIDRVGKQYGETVPHAVTPASGFRNITITFADGSQHVYQNVPDSVTPDQIEQRAKQDFSGKQVKAIDGGRKPGPPPGWSKAMRVGDSYDEPVKAYIDKRKADFVLTPDLSQQIREGAWSLRWNRFIGRFKEASPFVVGTIVFIWLFAAVLGWIIRGFAGIPRGQDFRPAKRKDSGD